MKLISSAAYVEQDLAYEFGRLPPAFLPIGNRRLYEYQFELLSDLEGDIYLSLPESFQPPDYDLKRLGELGILVIFVPDGLSLGNSILYSWAATGVVYEKLCILHGDTLFMDFPLVSNDFVSVHPNFGSYRRARIDVKREALGHFVSDFVDDEQSVLSGLFSFSRPHALMQGIVYAKGDFIGGVERYRDSVKLDENTGGTWLDFGHLNSFFKSRSLMTTQRAFNNLRVTSRTVTKSSIDARKMYAESNWFSTLPIELHLHAPALIQRASERFGWVEYTTEYLYLLPLNDLLVFSKLPLQFWVEVFKSAREMTGVFRSYKPDTVAFDRLGRLYLPKTLERLESLNDEHLFDIPEFNGKRGVDALCELAYCANEYISCPVLEDIGIVHGDYCFSNILFDSRTRALKLIDPRGIDSDGNMTIYGDTRYDIAKFYHSAVGGYDYIISGRYHFESGGIVFYEQKHLDDLEKLFDRIFFDGDFSKKPEVISITILLFISMLPLHSDRPDRQRAMVSNAFRLFRKVSGGLL
jgi:hypothetical protein